MSYSRSQELSPTFFSAGKASSGVLYPILGTTLQERVNKLDRVQGSSTKMISFPESMTAVFGANLASCKHSNQWLSA